MPTFGSRLDKLLKKKGISEAKLARMLGISSQAVNQWTSGKVQGPAGKRYAEIADALGVPVSTLLDPEASIDTDERPKKPAETAIPKYQRPQADAGEISSENGSSVVVRKISPEVHRFLVKVGWRLRVVREIVTNDVQQCCDMFNVKDRSIWEAWERGDAYPDALVLVAFCDRFGVTMDWLARGRVKGMHEDVLLRLAVAHPEALEQDPALARPSKGVVEGAKS